jgi:hypothetical protein
LFLPDPNLGYPNSSSCSALYRDKIRDYLVSQATITITIITAQGQEQGRLVALGLGKACNAVRGGASGEKG